ncbi:MAG: hypothetical protein ACPF86_04490, partial [Luminiphilus sp.]
PHSASENKRCSIDEALGTTFATLIMDARCSRYLTRTAYPQLYLTNYHSTAFAGTAVERPVHNKP